jgi:hypothetical protein
MSYSVPIYGACAGALFMAACGQYIQVFFLLFMALCSVIAEHVSKRRKP